MTTTDVSVRPCCSTQWVVIIALVALAHISCNSSITLNPYATALLNPYDIKPKRIELIQAVTARFGTNDPAIPLVASKEALVRVYVVVTSAKEKSSPQSISVALEAFRDGNKLPQCNSGLLFNPTKNLQPISASASDATVEGMRDNLVSTYNFSLPAYCTWTSSGTVTLRATVSGPTQCPGCKADDVLESSFQFHETRPIRVKPVLIAYNHSPSANQGKSGTYSTSGLDYVVGMYPTAGVEVLALAGYSTTKDLEMYPGHDPNEGFNDWWDDYGKLRDDIYYAVGGDADVVLVILHTDVVGCWGISAPGVAVSGQDCAGTYAHEMGHAFGLCHAGNDHGEAKGGGTEIPWPYPHGGIIGMGWDPEAPTKLILPSAGGAHSHDTMSYGSCSAGTGYNSTMQNYCSNWFSPLNYGRIAKRLGGKSPFDSLMGLGQATSCPVAAGGQATAHVVRPDRSSGSQDTEHLIVAGRILDGRRLELRPFYRRMLPARERAVRNRGLFRIELEASDGTVLLTHHFQPVQTFAHMQGSVTLIDEMVPWNSSARRVVIKREELVMADRELSINAPTCRILTPKAGEILPLAGQLSISWQATDADGDALAYWIEYSADGGRTWETLQRDLTETTYETDLALLRGSDQGLVRVIATDGINTAVSQTGALTVPKKAPRASIMSPPLDRNTSVAAPVVLKGVGVDQEDGPLRGNALTWTSNRDGVLGSGQVLVVSRLSRGLHTITLTVTDSDKQKGRASILLTVR
jgi:hypothetical protein